VVGLRQGRLCFDLPAAAVQQTHLRELYAGSDTSHG
jgi:ABC-type phosphate/phosphonate transport system ATPase subunit